MGKNDTKEEMVRMNFTCPPKYQAYIEAVAEAEDRPMSSVFRLAVEALAAERKEEIEGE